MKRIALIGMPNTGKSTLFNRISGASARVGNWPGITVDLMSAKVLVGSHITEIVDLPGLYDLHGFSDDEQVVRHFLTNNEVDLVLIVVNSTQIDRQLSLVLQIRSLGLPAIVVLNMQDESKRAGISINTAAMAEQIQMPVLTLSAKYGDGCPTLLQKAASAINQDLASTNKANVAKCLESDNQIEAEMRAIIQNTVQIPKILNNATTDKIDRVLLHPWLGLPIFITAVFLLFQFIFTVGTPLQDGMAWLFDTARTNWLEPLLSTAPTWLNGLLLDGIYNGMSTVAAFVPIIILFFLVMSMVEDSGYLSRAAFLMDTLMAKLGLDGRSFVMVLMGFGCNVPALMGTRVMRSRGMRLLTMLTIPFSLCSARLQIFIFMIAILFKPHQAAWVMFSLYMMSLFSIFLTALLFKGRFDNNEPFILELPPYRFPTMRQIWLRGWLEVQHFLERATKFIVLGVIMVWLLTNFPNNVPVASEGTYAGQIGAFFAPVLDPIGIDTKLAIALIFGFVAKEIVVGSLAVIYGLQGDALMSLMAQNLTWIQGMSFMLFSLIYTPCLSTIATIKSESKNNYFMWLSIIWSLFLAWAVSFVFYQSARLLGF